MRATRLRLYGTLAAALFAALALGSGLDRLSSRDPGLGRLVPDGFSAGASRALAAGALARGDPRLAAISAREALVTLPADRRAAGLFGTALLLGDETERAERVFAHGARLGWRDPLTQAYWFDRRLREGDAEAAALHLDVILRAFPNFAPAQDYLAWLETSEAGRSALLARLVAHAPWAQAYLAAPQIEDDTLFLRAALLAGDGPVLGCQRVRPMVTEVLARNRRGVAERLWARQCPSASLPQPVVDSKFAQLAAGDASLFGWRRRGAGDVSLDFEASAGLQAESRASVTRALVEQPVALSPETYRITGESKPQARFVATLGCGRADRADGAVEVGEEGARLVVPDCEDQVLTLWLRPGPGTARLPWVRVEPLSHPSSRE
ncbi:MAG: hypothetical protein ACR2FJ_07390 [Qipengyuania sp.]